MHRRHSLRGVFAAALLLAPWQRVSAQQHEHAEHVSATESLPTRPGQSAFAAIAEVVRLLKADPQTNWSKVNIEALRQHLIDMDEVTMHASASQRDVPNGVRVFVTANGRTLNAVQRMVPNQVAMLNMSDDYSATAAATSTGATITITVKRADSDDAVKKLRALGYFGLVTEGDHHARHHMLIARGDSNPHKH